MTGDGALAASVVVCHTISWALVAVLVVATGRRWRREPRFALVALALGTVVVGWDVMLTSASAAPVAQGAAAAALPLLLATYPDGRFVPRWLVGPALALTGCGVLAMAVGETVTGSPWWRVVNWATLCLLAAQVHRYRRRATTAERAGVRWALLGTLVALSGCLVLLALTGTVIDDSSAPTSLAIANVLVAAMPVGLAVGLVRPQLWDVDRALRAVVAGLVVLLGAGSAYALALAVVHSTSLGEAAGARVAALVAVTAALPTGRVAIGLADRLLYRGRPDPGVAAGQLGTALAAEPDPARVPDVVVSTVSRTLGLESVQLRRGQVVLAEAGSGCGPTATVPVTYQDEPLAVLVVRPRRGETALTARDCSVLDRLALHAAPALHGARAVADLTEARSRLVRLRAEERKALRRDIHDDLGPTLAGLGLAAAAVAAMVKDGDAEAAVVAESLVGDVHSAMRQVRELTHDLRPPILDDEGLVATIRARVERAPGPPLVHVRAPAERLVLPAAVEVAALRIAQEAVSNVRRHARATRCELAIAVRDGVLHLSVTDDGVGFPQVPAAHRQGLGLASIRERAAELGGSAHVRSPAGGGVTVEVALPCELPCELPSGLPGLEHRAGQELSEVPS